MGAPIKICADSKYGFEVNESRPWHVVAVCKNCKVKTRQCGRCFGTYKTSEGCDYYVRYPDHPNATFWQDYNSDWESLLSQADREASDEVENLIEECSYLWRLVDDGFSFEKAAAMILKRKAS